MEVSPRIERVTKRQKVSTRKQHESTPTTTIERSSEVPQYQTEKGLTTPLSKERRRSLWLAALTPEELGAGGGNWHNVPPSSICFVCKKPGNFLKCTSCPRSYHPECIPPDHDTAPEDWSCPACAILDSDDKLVAKTTGRLAEIVQSSATWSSEETASPKLPESTILVAGPPLTKITQSGTSKEGSQESDRKPIHSAERQSSGVGAATLPLKVVQMTGVGDGMQPNKPRRVKLPDPSSDASHMRFINAHPEIAHHHNSTSYKPEQTSAKKRSRYSTLPTEVDEALAIINRQLEVASHSKSMLDQATTRLHILEQDLMIERGKLKLTASQGDKVDEVTALKEELKLKDDMIDDLMKRNEQLTATAECRELKVKELEAWKMRMKMMIDGN